MIDIKKVLSEANKEYSELLRKDSRPDANIRSLQVLSIVTVLTKEFNTAIERLENKIATLETKTEFCRD